jgi:CubicO group peptidase (beta-lactamase class C family)
MGFSGSVLVVRDGAAVVAVGRGLADRELEIPNDPNTAFDVGSVMKDVTAIAIYRLEADGLLTRDDALGSWLDAPPDKVGITLQQLLDHEAGFDEYHDDAGDFQPMTRTEALERILSQTLLFAPGESEAYSNSGYTLLATVVEEAAGQPFLTYVRALLDGGGFTRTGTYGDGLWSRSEVAVGYDALTHGDRNSPFDWGAPSWALIGNGGLVSTANELSALLASIETPPMLPMDAQARFAEEYLVSDYTLAGKALVGFGGGNDFGFGAELIAVPSLDLHVVVLSNNAAIVDPLVLAAQLLMSAAGELIAPGAADG